MAEKLTSIKEFGERIAQGVETDPAELPQSQTAAWFGPGGSLLYLELFKPNPLDRVAGSALLSYSVIAAIFHDDETIRVYTLPAAIPDPRPTDWKVRSPGRTTLTKTAPTYVTEAIPLDTMADLIIDEWNALAGASSPADAELAAVVDYIESLNETVSRERLVSDLTEGLHRGEAEPDDDDDEPEEPAPPALPVVGNGHAGPAGPPGATGPSSAPTSAAEVLAAFDRDKAPPAEPPEKG
jgi:hypothetical protein